MGEKIVETKICKLCSASFDITDKDLEFYDKISPIFNDKKYLIPTPTLCPECRQQRRLSFRNERSLYYRNCDLDGKKIISIYSPEKPYKVYEQGEWWSDRWSALDYGKDFDFSRSFFEQFGELMREVPRMALVNKNTENSDFNNYIEDAKNCYMSNRVYYNCEDIYYSYRILSECRNLFDCYSIEKTEIGYELIDCKNCFDSYSSQNCNDCANIHFSYNLQNCKNCFLCSNLSGKEYFIFNKEHTREDYFDFLKKRINGSFKEFVKNKTDFSGVLVNAIRKNLTVLECENYSGDFLYSSKNSSNSFNCINCEDMNYSFEGNDSKLIYDTTGFGKTEVCYDSAAINRAYNLLFAFWSFDVKNSLYIDFCFNGCSNLFGCISLRNKQYCILNKQYTKEEYETLVPKIIEHMKKTGEWGEFFPSSLSPFGYNETVASEYFPLSREEALKRGFNWSDYEAPFPKVEKIIPASKLPDDISKIPDDILNWAIECEVTGKPFRIIKQELEFYRKHDLPIPRRHPDQRHLDRMKLRNPRKLYDRKCDKCGVDMKTTYAPGRKEIVYCETCYNKEVVG